MCMYILYAMATCIKFIKATLLISEPVCCGGNDDDPLA